MVFTKGHIPYKKKSYPIIPSLCQCGCNEIVYNSGQKFIKGHKSQEHKKRSSELMLENNNPAKRPEVRAKISKAKIGHYPSSETKEKISKSRAGKCSGKNNCNWRGGTSFLPYCDKWNHQLREEIRNEFNRKCYICNKDEKDNITKSGKMRRLSIHHIDLDKGQGCNGKKWKLIPLCGSCHSKLHRDKIELGCHIK